MQQSPLARGRLYHTRGKIGEIEDLMAFIPAGRRAFQVVGFAAASVFPSVERELRAAIDSFDPSEAEPKATVVAPHRAQSGAPTIERRLPIAPTAARGELE